MEDIEATLIQDGEVQARMIYKHGDNLLILMNNGIVKRCVTIRVLLIKIRIHFKVEGKKCDCIKKKCTVNCRNKWES